MLESLDGAIGHVHAAQQAADVGVALSTIRFYCERFLIRRERLLVLAEAFERDRQMENRIGPLRFDRNSAAVVADGILEPAFLTQKVADLIETRRQLLGIFRLVIERRL